MLDTKNLALAHTSDAGKSKLAPKKIGPYEIEAMINENAARLRLPRSMRRLHPVFNVDLLSHYALNPENFQSRPIPKALRVVLDDDGGERYVIEALLKRRQFNRKKEWLVKWHGLPDHESSWELEKNIKNVVRWRQLLRAFKDFQREFKSGRMS